MKDPVFSRCAPGGALLALMGAAVAPSPALARAEDAAEGPWMLSAAYTADLLRNTRGGLATGNAYLDNLDLTLEVDAERAFGLRGLTLFAYGLYNNGKGFSEEYAGDAQTVSSIDAPRAIRLYEAWAQWQLDGPRGGSVRFGLYDLNSEFDVSEGRGLFVHSAFGIGHEIAQTGEQGPSIFPVTSLGLRVAMHPGENWTLLAAALDGVPGDPDDPTRTRIRLRADEGALLVAELHREGERLRKLAFGTWSYTERFAHIDAELGGVPEPRTGRSRGAYALAELAAWQDGRDPERRLDVFARIGTAAGAVNEYDGSLQAGLVLSQPWASPREHALGLAFSRASTSGAFRRGRAALDEPLESHETTIELTYRSALTPWLTVQPDVQYVMNPGAEPGLRDALVVGVRLELAGEWAW